MARVAPTSTGNPNEVHSSDVPIRGYQALDMTSPQGMRHTDIITCASFLPDGRSAVTSCYDKTLRLWNIRK